MHRDDPREAMTALLVAAVPLAPPDPQLCMMENDKDDDGETSSNTSVPSLSAEPTQQRSPQPRPKLDRRRLQHQARHRYYNHRVLLRPLSTASSSVAQEDVASSVGGVSINESEDWYSIRTVTTAEELDSSDACSPAAVTGSSGSSTGSDNEGDSSSSQSVVDVKCTCWRGTCKKHGKRTCRALLPKMLSLSTGRLAVLCKPFKRTTHISEDQWLTEFAGGFSQERLFPNIFKTRQRRPSETAKLQRFLRDLNGYVDATNASCPLARCVKALAARMEGYTNLLWTQNIRRDSDSLSSSTSSRKTRTMSRRCTSLSCVGVHHVTAAQMTEFLHHSTKAIRYICVVGARAGLLNKEEMHALPSLPENELPTEKLLTTGKKLWKNLLAPFAHRRRRNPLQPSVFGCEWERIKSGISKADAGPRSKGLQAIDFDRFQCDCPDLELSWKIRMIIGADPENEIVDDETFTIKETACGSCCCRPTERSGKFELHNQMCMSGSPSESEASDESECDSLEERYEMQRVFRPNPERYPPEDFIDGYTWIRQGMPDRRPQEPWLLGTLPWDTVPSQPWDEYRNDLQKEEVHARQWRDSVAARRKRRIRQRKPPADTAGLQHWYVKVERTNNSDTPTTARSLDSKSSLLDTTTTVIDLCSQDAHHGEMR